MAIQNLVPTEGIIDSDARRTEIRPLGKVTAQQPPPRTISVIAAADRDGAIGRDGTMPWHIGADLRRFKALTTGHAVLMGRRTWESLPVRPLPGRLNVVLTRNVDYDAPGARVAPSITEALALLGDSGEVFVIGGGDVYRQALPMASRLYLTRVDTSTPGADTFFPAVNPEEWTMTESMAMPACAGAPPFRFENYVRSRRAT